MVDKTTTQAGWTGADPFYLHMRMLWDAEAETRWKVNQAPSLGDKLRAIEDWYETLGTIQSRIDGFVEDSEKSVIDAEFAEIEKLVKNSNFVDAGLGSSDIYTLRKKLRSICSQLFKLMAKYRMLLPVINIQHFDDVFEEIDAESV